MWPSKVLLYNAGYICDDVLKYICGKVEMNSCRSNLHLVIQEELIISMQHFCIIIYSLAKTEKQALPLLMSLINDHLQCAAVLSGLKVACPSRLRLYTS